MASVRESGDWDCLGCGQMNYKWREQCRRGSRKRDCPQSTILVRRERPKGDWSCGHCGKHQFARNRFRRDCGTGKGGAATEEKTLCEVSDECIICMDRPNNTMLLHDAAGTDMHNIRVHALSVQKCWNRGVDSVPCVEVPKTKLSKTISDIKEEQKFLYELVTDSYRWDSPERTCQQIRTSS